MENASKALIMAGSILLALLIISLSIVTFRNFSSSANPDFTEAEVGDFNSKILPYCGDHVAGSQVNALLQYVRALNVSNDPEDKPTIEVEFEFFDESGNLKGGTLNRGGTFDESSGKVKRVETGTFYKVEVTTYWNTGYISEIKVSEVP